MIIGIDPGQTGGIAAIKGNQFLDGIRMPKLKHGKRWLINTRTLDGFVLTMGKPARVVIEQVSAMPRQGVTSSFNFGRNTGAVEGWALGLGVPVEWVTPSVWKKHFNLSKDKQASLDLARLKFGDKALWKVKANDGIAEAALIALYWQDKH